MNNDYDDLFEQAGKKYGIDPDFLKAHATYESGLNPDFKNPDSSASGLTGFTDATAKDYNVDRKDPASAIDAQARYLKANYEKFKDSADPVTAAISAYKTGPNSDQTDTHYVNNVMQVYNDIKKNNASTTSQDQSVGSSPGDKLAAKLASYSTNPINSGTSNDAVSGSAGDRLAAKLASYGTAAEGTNLSSPPPVDNSPQGTYNTALENARSAVSPSGQSIPGVPNTSGAPAQLLGYAANAESSIPGMHEAGSAIAAGLGAGQGDTFGERYNNLEQSQQALRQAGEEANPGATAMGQVGTALATAPLFPSVKAVTNLEKIGSGMLSGAGYGTAYGLGTGDAAKDTAASQEDRLTNALQGGEYGGAFGGAIPAALNTGEGLAKMISRVGTPEVEKATNALHQIVGAPVDNLDTTVYVPGSKPTLANAAAYAGDPNAGNVAALEKTLSESALGSQDIYNPEFAKRAQANNDARRNAVLGLTGSTDDLSKAYKDRSAIAKNMLEDGPTAKAIWNDPNAKPADTQPVLDTIDNILKGPDRGNTSVQKTLGNIKNILQPGDKPETDPEYLYRSGVKTINQWLESNHPADELSQLAKAASPQVNTVKSALQDAIKNAVPGYGNYLSEYAKASKPIDQMESLQGLKLVNPESDQSAPTLSKVNSALQKIMQQRSQPGTNPFKSLAPEHIEGLKNIQSDLERDQSAQNLLQTKGSPTGQNIQFQAKVKDALNAQAPQWPKTLGAAAGGSLGGISQYLGAPGPLSMIAATAGAGLGEKVGEAVSSKIASKGSKAARNVANLLLEPSVYNAQQAVRKGPGLSGHLNPFNTQGVIGNTLEGSNYTPAIGYGANKLLQTSQPSGSQNNE